MYIVGITGAMGAGKSTVAHLLAGHGAHLLDSDRLSRLVVERGTPGLAEVVAAFGPGVLQRDGSLDRGRLGELVFTNPEARGRLEGLLHPRIRHLQWETLTLWAAETPDAVVVLDIPLLFETGAETRCDLTVAVRGGAAREQRLAERNRMGEEARRGAEAGQLSEAEKCRRADRVIDNSGSRDNTARQVAQLWEELRGRGGEGRAWPEGWRNTAPGSS